MIKAEISFDEETKQLIMQLREDIAELRKIVSSDSDNKLSSLANSLKKSMRY